MTNSEATTPVGEWVEWHGGPNPVPGRRVAVKIRQGGVGRDISSDHLVWDHRGNNGDIIAYRLVEDASGKAEKLAALLANTTPGGPDGSCMEWRGRVESAGYGVIHEGRKRVRVHRETLSLAKGLPGGLFALHHCDNRRCINPEHLFAGTKADNNRDMTAKGRLVVFRGEDRTTAKLTAENVAYIHASSDSHKALGLRFGVDRNLIRRVRTGEAWAHCHPSRLVSAPAVVGDVYDRLLTFLGDRDNAIQGDPPCATELDASVHEILEIVRPTPSTAIPDRKKVMTNSTDISERVSDYVASYEFRGESDHTPTDDERALIEDAIHGFIADHVTASPDREEILGVLREARSELAVAYCMDAGRIGLAGSYPELARKFGGNPIVAKIDDLLAKLEGKS